MRVWGLISRAECTFVVTLALSMGACGGTNGAEDAHVPRGDGGPDASASCARDLDCDDGRYCTGLERCVDTVCAPGDPPCDETQLCDEAGARCDDSTCVDGGDADGDGHRRIGCGGDDCDDANGGRFPDNTEVCDAAGLDEDCDPTTLGTLDADGDGFVSSACCQLRAGSLECGPDCDDSNLMIHPEAAEVCNGIDDDCDPATAGPGEDDDGDGFLDADCGGDDCYDMWDDVGPDMCDVVDLAAGVTNTCIIFRLVSGDTELRCSGENDSGQVGSGTSGASVLRPSRVEIEQPVDVEIGVGFACARDAAGEVWCWGSNSIGRLGQGAGGPASSPSPLRVPGLTGVTSLAAEGAHACAVDAGQVKCWGGGLEGEIGDGALANRSSPTAASLTGTSSTVSAGNFHTCASRTTGELYCWGRNAQGQLGDGTQTGRGVPTRVVDYGDWVVVAAGNAHTCGLRGSRALYCWGDQVLLGGGTTGIRPRPLEVRGYADLRSFDVGMNHTCVVLSSGQPWCWGRSNTFGQIGDGTTSTRSAPTPVMGLTDAAQVQVSAAHTCALRETGQVLCWGQNVYGQLADGSTDVRVLPTPIHP